VAIRYETHADGHIALITIDRPDHRNSLDAEHFHLLAESWRRFRDDDQAWVAIITGVGDAFCTGADLKNFIPKVTAAQREIAQGTVTDIDGFPLADSTFAVLRDVELYKPIIAAINGFCVAGGMEMVGGIDIRIASENASMGVFEPRQGLFAGGGTTVRLPRQISYPHAMEVLLTADPIPAPRAYEMGLVNEVCSSEELLDRAFDWARRIAKNAPIAIQATKESVLRGLAVDMAEAYGIEMKLSYRVFTSEDAKEGPRAFAEKRPPNWQAR
jgi:enoyl-CoA hydratase